MRYYKHGPIGSGWPGIIECDDPQERRVVYFDRWPDRTRPSYYTLTTGELQDYLRQGYWAVFDNDLEVDVGL